MVTETSVGVGEFGEFSSLATALIVADAKDRMSRSQPLTKIQRVLLRDWASKARERLRELHNIIYDRKLTDEEEIEGNCIIEELRRYRKYL